MSASTMPRGSRSCRYMANQRKESAVAFLEAAVAYYAKLGIRIERVMTDNGSCYRSKSVPGSLQTPRPPPSLHQALHARRPMARPSASSRPRFANGPMLAPITTRINDRPRCSTGSIATIGIGHMVA